ncbi:MAG TPA: outer membrane lipoprotein carrier protein LolA [Azospirillaceae bacterium]|nr:outer membrane lipoprotein carrier protein LolA [Azospirillaceae bacterium]
MKALVRAFALLVLITIPALAAPRPAELSAADRTDLARVEEYLNGIRTLRSSFVQATPDGTLMKGVFYLSRPGKMRLEYEPPVKDYVVADGLFVFYWDDRMQQSSSAPIGSTLADVILRKDLKLSGAVTVTGVHRSPGTLEVSLVQTDDPGKGELTLVFEDKPLRLRKWRVVDAQSLTTEVALLNPQLGVELDKNLFFFSDPNLGKRRE